MGVPEPESRYVLAFREIDRTQTAVVGGKGAALGELSRIEGLTVPAGFCVTTHASARVTAEVPSLDDMLDRLSHLDPEDRDVISALSAEIRLLIEGVGVPDDVASAVTSALAELGEDVACAVRSSATAEDLPSASFAGQHDTFLDVVGPAAILQAVSRCWASLFTERAVTYRARNGLDQRGVRMAVVVQRMVDAEASGVLFTADPATSNRKVASMEAVFGLGEALVSGRATPDVFKVRDGEVVAKSVVAERPVLTDAQVVRLDRLGRLIEAHFGCPQDIEWCLAGDALYVVQSRPITTLFPIPQVGDRENHVYVSVGHQQMMTDAMRPLGLSMWRLTALRPMYEAGGRLFVDVTKELASPEIRDRVVQGFSNADPLIGDALATILARPGFLPPAPAEAPPVPAGLGGSAPIENDPEIVAGLIARNEASVDELERDIRTKSGSALLDFILADIQELQRLLRDPQNVAAIMAGIEATAWLNTRLQEWLGERNVADTLTQSIPNNVTSEMGLALLDVADVIRPHPDVVAYLRDTKDEGFLDELPRLDGGRESRDSIRAYLDKYGMRCVGEIDITRPRWSERPTTLLPMILSDIKNFEEGAAERLFERGREEALNKEREILARLRELPGGELKAAETKRMIDRVRIFVGYREYPKYGIVRRYFIYKQALLREAERLVDAGALTEKDDIYYLTFEELQDVARTRRADERLVRRRRDEYKAYQALTPPRVLTSEGEVVAGAYHRQDLPADALVGLAVSAGVVEGRARVILEMAQADPEPGDILVTVHTDPSWSPLFVTIAGLVTEVGGLMTHGAVVAREYGLPTVVGVQDATRLIRDGQRIRVDGTRGYVEILADA